MYEVSAVLFPFSIFFWFV